jgi:RNA polymerase sigma factor (sigma-70 family)
MRFVYQKETQMTDRDNETWIAELKGERGKQRQETAFQDLGKVLLSLIRWYLSNSTALPPGLAHGSLQDLDQLAQDIVQDSLVRIWQKGLDLYRGEAKFLTFAKAIAINQARQKLRQMWRQGEELWPSLNADGTDEDSEILSIAVRSKMVMEELSPEKQVMLRDVAQYIDRILAGRCSLREREAFVKKHLDGLTSKETAQSMNTTDRAVNLLTFNARQKLREGLEENGYTLATLLGILDP